jgi:hypothetical protein
MGPGITDGMALAFFFFFWGAIFWMIVWSFAYVAHAMPFSWAVIFALAVFFSYVTVWFEYNKG